MKPKSVPSTEEQHYEQALRVLATQFKGLDTTSLEAYILLVKVSQKISARMDDFLENYGIARGRFIVLVSLFTCPEKSQLPSVLAERAEVTRATMTGLLDTLEKDGLVQRRPGSDRRSLEVKLTNSGEKLLRKILPHHFRTVGEFMEGVTDHDRSSLAATIRKISRNLEALKKKTGE